MAYLRKPSRSSSVFGGATWLLVLCGTAQNARAAEITWSTAPECGDVAAIRTHVGQLTRRQLEAVEDLDFEVHAAADGELWRVTIRTRTRSTRTERVRELSAVSCAEATEVAALSIAMTISAHEQGGDGAPLPTAARPEPRVEPAAEMMRPASPRRATAGAGAGAGRTWIALGAALALDYGALPKLAIGPRLELSVGLLEALRLVALGTVLLPERATIQGTREGGDFGLALAAVLGCAEIGSRHILGLGCAGFEVGALSIEAVRLAPLDTRTRLMFAPRAELGLNFRITREIAVFFRLGGTLPLRRPVFESEQRPLFHPSRITVRGAIGAEYSL